jgi:hypothetical protein
VNKDLYGEKIELPEEIVVYLKQCNDVVPDADESVEGFRRNKELRDSGFVTYQQLKRIKNFFDSFQGNNTDKPFVLNGGDYMKNWVNQTLNSMRDNAYRTKEIRSVALPNQFIQAHEKNQNVGHDLRQTQDHKSSVVRYNLEVTESLKRINNLLKKII